MRLKEDMEIKEQGERWKALAEIFLKEDKRAYIKDSVGDIYFCDVILVGDDSITVQCFAPEQRTGEKFVLYWPLIVKFEEYREVGE